MEGGGTGTGTGIGGSPLAQPQPPPAKDVDEAALALTKRARKRSRYLSPPYTDRDVQEEEVAGEEPPPDASAAEALSAVLAAALRHGQAVDPAALRFLALYRRNRNRAATATFDTHPGCRAAAGGGGSSSKPPFPAPAATVGGGHTVVNPSAGPAIRPGDGSPAPAKKKNPQDNPPADGQIWARKSAAGFAANASNGIANPTPPPKRKKKYRNRMRGAAGHEQQHSGNPAALVLDFAAGAPLPSKEDLVSAFRVFGAVIDSETVIAQDKRSARVAFGTRAEAEAAFSCAGALGAFGPPDAVPSLQDLPPAVRGAPPPVPRLPLTYIRSNLEKMIASSSFRAANSPEEAAPAMDNLVGEMQGLLAKVDKMLQGRSAAALHH